MRGYNFFKSIKVFLSFHSIFKLSIVISIISIMSLVGLDVAYGVSLNLDLGEDNKSFLSGDVMKLIVLTTIITLTPSLILMTTAFTRIIVSLSLLKNAIGLQQSPPNNVLIALAFFLTIFIMMPTFDLCYQNGIKPLLENEISEEEALSRISQPIHSFMVKNVGETELITFLEIGNISVIPEKDMVPYRVLIPAFIISELKKAFEIGFLLFLPFIIIDLLVASVLMSMGMMMLPPVMISTPFKLVFFILTDGWSIISGSIVRGFVQ